MTNAFFLPIRYTPAAKINVTVIGSPSGIAETDIAITMETIAVTLYPLSKPIKKVNTPTKRTITIIHLDNFFILSLSGTSVVIAESSPDIFPMTVSTPTAVTTASAKPPCMVVPLKTIFLCLKDSVASDAVSSIFSSIFSTASDSPVSEDSSISKSVICISRASAPTLSPSRKTMMSPTTSSVSGIESSAPSRMTVEVVVAKFLSAASVSSAFPS